MEEIKEMVKDCIHCKRCTRNCEFLTKYNIDIGNIEELEKVAYHCFLCGECDRVCPKNIECREVVLKLRQKHVRENNDKIKGYPLLLAEKSNYIFKNYSKSNKKSVLFPGCNFPSFYPKSLDKIISILGRYNIGVAFDCCGKPVAELGLEKDEKRIIDSINKNLRENGVEEVIMLCPNCYYFLDNRLEAKIVSIYDKLKELGIGKSIDKDLDVFVPCPDKYTFELLESINDFAPSIKMTNKKQCCGLGGVAIVKEKEMALGMSREIAKHDGQLYTYCATCAGNIKKAGEIDIVHILLEILEDEIGFVEQPDVKRSVFNRAKRRF